VFSRKQVLDFEVSTDSYVIQIPGMQFGNPHHVVAQKYQVQPSMVRAKDHEAYAPSGWHENRFPTARQQCC